MTSPNAESSDLRQKFYDEQKFYEEKFENSIIDREKVNGPKPTAKNMMNSFHRRTTSFSPSIMKKSFLQKELGKANPDVSACKIGFLKGIQSLLKPTNKFVTE